MDRLANKLLCTGCAACVNICPVNAITMQEDKDTFLYPVVDKNLCINCGKCEKACPLNNIKIVDKKPVWEGSCTHCMACIANCPVNSIQYGNITQKKERYNFGKYKYVVKNIEENKKNN